jgi:hypothetical protein
MNCGIPHCPLARASSHALTNRRGSGGCVRAALPTWNSASTSINPEQPCNTSNK